MIAKFEKFVASVIDNPEAIQEYKKKLEGYTRPSVPITDVVLKYKDVFMFAKDSNTPIIYVCLFINKQENILLNWRSINSLFLKLEKNNFEINYKEKLFNKLIENKEKIKTNIANRTLQQLWESDYVEDVTFNTFKVYISQMRSLKVF